MTINYRKALFAEGLDSVLVTMQGSALEKRDKEKLAALWGSFSTYSERPRPDHFRFFQTYPQNIYFLLYEENSDKLIGTATLIPNRSSQKWHVSLEDLVIAPGYRRHGYGQKLLESILEWVKKSEDYFSIQATVHPKRIEMTGLCEKIGMRIAARASGNEPGDVNLFRLVLVATE